jgi:hypothetical protein
MKRLNLFGYLLLIVVFMVGCEEDTFIHNEDPITQSQSFIDPNAKATITPEQISALGKKNKSTNIGYESAALGDIFVLDFEGLGNFDGINNYYNGGTSGKNLSGPNYGVEFLVAESLIDSDAGGSGSFANVPSGVTAAYFSAPFGYSGLPFINVYAGFETGLSFFYSSARPDGIVSVYDKTNGLGNLLGTINLSQNYDANCPDGSNGTFCNWNSSAISFTGTAKSVVFINPGNILFDDITFGSITPGAIDSDGDGISNDNDNCPMTVNPGQEDFDGDSFGDVCDDDIDGDGISNDNDNCIMTVNPGQEDFDGDGLGDVCDDDFDGDGISNDNDNCIMTVNPGQEDFDGDGLGDVCDVDIDGDGISNDNDNCPLTVNPKQENYDGDLNGDVCDLDDDNDGCLDVVDPIPFSNLETTVNLDGCDSGVDNRITSNCGYTMSDMIDALEAGTYKNHGQFVSAMASLSNSWKASGLISGEEKDAIMTCADSSDIGRK